MIPERCAGYPTDVVCLEGGGFPSAGSEEADLSPGHKPLWPADGLHRLWTEDESMVALMIELTRWAVEREFQSPFSFDSG